MRSNGIFTVVLDPQGYAEAIACDGIHVLRLVCGATKNEENVELICSMLGYASDRIRTNLEAANVELKRSGR